jgi:acetoacetyl-CoA reductase
MARVAIVTGGTRGIGKAISKALKDAGHAVAATYHGNDEAAAAFTTETGVKTYKWDVANFDACQEGAAKVAAELGPVDILVNNAGITRDATILRMSHDDWQSVIDTNLGSCFNMSKAVFGGMRERKFGRIVNISSINGQKGQLGQVNYSAAKAGMMGFSKALAQEGARYGITVNTLAPGYTETDMVAAVPEKILDSIVAQIPIGRLGTVGDVARAVMFLVADDAGWITGSTLTLNGGHYMA